MRPVGRFVTLLVSLFTVASLLTGPAAAAPPLEDSAAASPRLKYLPKDYWAVAELDCSTVMKFMTSDSARNNPQYAQLKEYLQLFKRYTSIDPEKDLDWITVFATGTPGDKPKGLAVVQGSFKNETVAKRLSANLGDSITEKTYKKHTIYSVNNVDLCFPEDATIVVGNEGLVREALDRVDGPRPLPKALKSVLERTPGKIGRAHV